MALGRLFGSLDHLCWSAGAAGFLKEGQKKWISTGNGAGVIRRLSFLLTATSSQGIISQPKSGPSWRARDKCCFSTRQHEKFQDLYSVMGVTPHATQQQIKEAYYKLSMEYHPDRNKGSLEAHQKFTALTEAFSILGQYDLRKKYDKGLLHAYPRHPHPPSRPTSPPTTNMQKSKVKYDFDAFHRAHYGEVLRRSWKEAKEKKAAEERAKLQTLSGSTQRVLIVTVTGLVFFVGWVIHRSGASIIHTGKHI